MVMRSGRTRGCLTAGARIDICPEPGRGVAAATEHVGRVPAGGSCPGTTTDAGEAVGGRPEPSADLLRQLDDDPLRAADVAEPIAVFVALHLANELRAAGSQASDDGVDIVDCECDMADARGVRRRVPVAAPARRGVKLCQLEPSVAVRGLHHRDLRPDALAAARSSTTMPTCSMRWIVMRSTVAERRPPATRPPATASLGCRSAGGNAPPIGLKRPAMSCSAQSGHSWVREPTEDAQ